MRKSVINASVLALIVAVAPACATKKFVRTEVGTVNTKVDTLTGTVEETQERTRRNEERIGTVDTKAEAAGRAAADARTAADGAATAARAVDTRLTSSVATVNGRIDANDAAIASVRKLVNEVTLSEDQGNFDFGKTDLPDAAKARLDEVVNQLKADPKLVWIEIEGHTDNVGSAETNERIGMERAEAVKRYLYMQHQIPLHKINVISYGEEKPVAPNNTRDGRAQNRRVVVRVLS
jgi:peptidoglycan-associated lipoprotein